MSKQKDASLVPPDFPRRGEGALSGVQPKLAARLIDGMFVAGETSEELVARFEACLDLATQLTELATRKRVQYAELPLKDYLRRLARGVVKKGWDLDRRELHWVMLQVAVGLGGGPADALCIEALVVPVLATSRAYTPVPSVVDLALSRLPNPLSHYRSIDDPSNLSRRAQDSRLPTEVHLLNDATFAISMAIRILSLPAFRLGD